MKIIARNLSQLGWNRARVRWKPIPMVRTRKKCGTEDTDHIFGSDGECCRRGGWGLVGSRLVRCWLVPSTLERELDMVEEYDGERDGCRGEGTGK